MFIRIYFNYILFVCLFKKIIIQIQMIKNELHIFLRNIWKCKKHVKNISNFGVDFYYIKYYKIIFK